MNTKILFTFFLIASSLFATAQQKQTVKKLPKEAMTFLEANFKGIAIQDMQKEKEGTSYKYEVKLANGAEIDFNSRGRWIVLESETVSLPTSMFQSSVGKYIKETYPSSIITEVKKGIRFNFVEIDNKTMLQFDTEGKFYKILK
jgi:hypothetical protein